MTRKRGHYGSGSIDPSGENSWRVRYRIEGKRFTKVVEGTKTEAAKELRRLLHSGDEGKHVAPDKITLAQWIDEWLALKERTTEAQTLERYATIMKIHVVPALGTRLLQKITATDVDKLYGKLEQKLSPRTMGLLHVVVKSCLATAVRKGLLSTNPADRAERPASDDSKVGMVLDEEQLTKLVQGFRGTSLYGIVAIAAFTGMRRSEIVALRWCDIDLATRTVSVTRSIERTEKQGLRVKGPKSARGRRNIKIDETLTTLLRSERDRYLRLVAGIPDGVEVDTSLVRLPDGALVFPATDCTDLTALRCPASVTKIFARRARRLGFPGMRFHDLRATHGTLLLDRGISVHTVAERLGHDPALLLRVYAKRTKKSDTMAADIIGTMTKGVL
jgi:integrase